MGRYHIVLTPLRAMIVAALLALLTRGLSTTPPVFADGPPTQTVADWTIVGDCVGPLSWTQNTEEHIKDTLPGEWVAGWDDHALKAGASIVRQDFWFKHNWREAWYNLPPGGFCNGVEFTYDVSKAYFHGYRKLNDCTPGPIRCDTTNAATDATKTMGWDAWDSDGVRPNNLELPFWSCVQNETDIMAALGYQWTQIVRSAIHPPGVYGGDPGPGDPTYCGTTPLNEYPYRERVYPPLIANCLYNRFDGDSDCDGFTDSRETFIGTDYQGRCGEGYNSGPSTKWPADFVSGNYPNSTDRANIFDVTSFLAPVRRFNTKPGDPNYSQRWDLWEDTPCSPASAFWK